MEKGLKKIGVVSLTLICDTEDCTYEGKDIAITDMKSHIGSLCPKCSQNLLTEEDYTNATTALAAISISTMLEKETDPDGPLYQHTISTHKDISVTTKKIN